MNTVALEADTRVLIDKNLENLGWVLDGKDRNVFFEQPKTEKERKLLGGERPDYVLYSKDERGEDKAIIVIEAKRRGARVDTALEQGIRYAKQLDAPIVFATDGLFCKSYHTKFDRTPILNGEEVDEFLREALAIKYLASWEVNTVSPKVQYDRKELIKIFDEANNMLRGDGLRAGIERFGEFANILFLKLISENERIKNESGKKTAFDDSCHWDIIKKIPKSGQLDYINQVYIKLNSLYKTEIFTQLTIRSEDILKEIMDKLDPLTLTDVDSDVKGDAFEYFLKESAATKNDLGEYFTPRHIVKTMVKLVNPQIGERIYDPFCGTGGFLIESFRHIWNTMPRNDKTIEMLKKETVFGNEITNTARITKMNMILAGDGHSNIHTKDSLAEPVDGVNGDGYDVVITNMPYSQKTKYGNLYDMPSSNGDSICVQHCMKAISSTSENGRMALVVPEGFLFRRDLAKTRELLLKSCDLQSVISLPQGVFLPYTGVKTNIIYATKVNQNVKTSQKRKDFWYFDVKSDGYTLDNHRRKLDSRSDLDKYQEYRKLDDDQRQNMLNVGFEIIPLKKVKDNYCVLVGSRYRNRNINDNKFDYYPLKDVCEIIAGQSPDGKNYNDKKEGMPFYQGNANFGIVYIGSPTIWTTQTTKEAQANDILVSVRAPVGAVNICAGTICIGRGLMAIRCKANVNYKYLFYILRAAETALKRMALGSTFEAVTKKDIEDFIIPVPPLAVQQQIVEELDGYQNIIDGARCVIESYKPTIPTKDEWETKKISDFFDLAGKTIDPQACNGVINYVGLENISVDSGDLIGNIEVDIQSIKSAKRKFEKGDILFGRLRPNLNKVSVAPFDGICSTDIIVLRPKSDDVIAEFYAVIMRSETFKKAVMNGVSGGQLPRVGSDYLLNIPMYKVPLPVQKTFYEQLKLERTLIEPSKQVIEVFTKKMQDRIHEIGGGK
ncbi:MAG: N-6 DNA methylase [Lachnospiraceae bacterium]|jgi:type I restriction enzyme M protein|nr:N-6 DNA methylase [Lachnospiraceae bacterium]